MSQVIDDAGQVTPEWLTGTLRRSGSLPSGSVNRVVLRETLTLPVSVVSHLEVAYSNDALSTAPHRLFLKISNPDFEPPAPRERPPAEIEFYASVAGAMPDPPLPRYFDGAFSRANGRSHLLLEDLSATHQTPLAPSPPAQCEQAVDALAQLHAFWWEHPQLGRGVGRLLSTEAVLELAHEVAANYARFADHLGERLPAHRRRLFDAVIDTFPRPWIRLSSPKGLTITHGDAHRGNFLYPLRPSGGRVYLIDWQLWHVHIGPRDLAYLLTRWLSAESRALVEQSLLRRYHQALLAGGVQGYGWDECWKDYRWSIVRNMFIPVSHWSKNRPADLWWPQLEKALRAFVDLRCIELVEG